MSRSGKVTVVGAGFYGSTTALRLAEYDVFETVVLTDILEGKSEGLALDINQSRSIEDFETNVNNSIIQTINRSLNTSFTVLIVLFSLMIVKLLTFNTSRITITNPIHRMSADSVNAF